jgi:predicted nucleic acid-binding protein
MRLFLDSSVLLAASGSANGASRLLITEAEDQNWDLMSSLYCLEETRHNLPKLGPQAEKEFEFKVLPFVECVDTRLVVDRPLVYRVTKDRPVVAGALAAKCDALLTLDRADFQRLLGSEVYGMWILTPGDWLKKNLV